ncbi:Uncharacterized protein APZ42_014107, partial [Daphnia magna]
MANPFSDVMDLFETESVPVLSEVPLRSKPGFCYIYQWQESEKKEDWRRDDYRWKQDGTCNFVHDGVERGKKLYFKLQIGFKEWSKQFKKSAYTHPTYDKKVLVLYEGDVSVVNDFCHGNATSRAKTEKVFHSDRPSLLKELKLTEGIGHPVKFYSDFVNKAPRSLTRQVIDAPRDLKQARNAQQVVRDNKRLSRDPICYLTELYYETDFISDLLLFPTLICLCYHKPVMENFQNLIGRSDLPAMWLSYDTTFKMGDFYLSILAYRDTQFEQRPRFTEIVPKITAEKKMAIATDEETAIVNSVKRYLPTVHWDSEEDFKGELIDLMCSWDKKFQVYFKQHIYDDAWNMGSWALRPYGFELATTNSSESLNASLKRFVNWKEMRHDEIVFALLDLSDMHFARIRRGQFGVGDDNILLPHLRHLYDINNPGVEIPKKISSDDILE